MTNTDEYTRARKRAEAKYGLFVHASVYGAVMLLLIVINLLTSTENLWFIWPLAGWGIALALHAISVYALADKTSVIDAMTERELRNSGTEKRDENV